MLEKCHRCDGTGWASAMRDAGQDASTPVMDRLIGVYSCPNCGGRGTIGMSEAEATALHAALKKSLKRKKSRRDK